MNPSDTLAILINADPDSMASAMTSLSVVVFGAVLLGYLGIWMLGVLFLAISILMIGVVFGRNLISL